MNLVVGDYLEVMRAFDGVCLIKETFKGIASKFPKAINAVQQYHKTMGERVFDVENDGVAIVYTPFHNMNKVKEVCEQLQTLAKEKSYQKILLPMPENYDAIKDILAKTLDDKFTVITDNPEYIKEIKVKESEPVVEKKVLECSSKGDKRFSALYAQVEYMNVVDTIEKHYQGAKRFKDEEGEYVALPNPKGKPVDGCLVFDELYEASTLTSFYSWLWLRYFKANPDLLTYAKGFDDYNDMFKGKAINSQADVIRNIVKDIALVEKQVAGIEKCYQEWLYENGTPEQLQAYQEVEETEEEPDMGFTIIDDEEVEVKPLTLIVTGHRPKDLFGYNDCAQYHTLQNKLYQCVLQFSNHYGVTRFISGGAQGIDQLFFWAVNYARKNNPALKNEVYIPFKGQELIWKETGLFSQESYRTMLNLATGTHVCNPNITGTPRNHVQTKEQEQAISKALTDRNADMVAQADFVIGVYKGDINLITNDQYGSGGTLNCLRKAYQAGKKIVILNPITLQTTRIGF